MWQNIKGKEAMIRKLVAVIPEIVDKHKIIECIYATWEDNLIDQVNPVLEAWCITCKKQRDRSS